MDFDKKSKENNQVIEIMKQARVLLAPMAGITDKPMRQLAKQFGADWTVSEMISDDPSLRHTRKTRSRSDHTGESGVIVVQIAGSDPQQMAQAAQYNADNGAQVIDINMGCPAKKVCNVAAGSALMKNEKLVAEILHSVVQAVAVPVTLKTRLGWDDEHRNLPRIARIAEQAGIAALAVHGRTRTQMYRGEAEYGLIAEVKQQISIPVWVNGDITSPQKAAAVLAQTGADGVMVGRGAQGQPWLFADIQYFLQHGRLPPPMPFQAACATVLQHLHTMHDFYGKSAGIRIARKHIGWYLARLPQGETFRREFNRLDNTAAQNDALAAFLTACGRESEFWPRNGYSQDIATASP